MIRITYAAPQAALAERIRDELTDAFPSARPVLIVLVSAASNADAYVQAEIAQARAAGAQLLPILVENVALPPALEDEKPLSFVNGFKRESLLRRLSQASMTGADIRKANRRALTIIGGIALVMFILAIISMASGIVGFPTAEYKEEATFQALWIDGLIRQTLEAVQPRSTADARNFAATHEAAPTRLFYYIRETATALAAEQEG
jgi:hypothetical protein